MENILESELKDLAAWLKRHGMKYDDVVEIKKKINYGSRCGEIISRVKQIHVTNTSCLNGAYEQKRASGQCCLNGKPCPLSVYNQDSFLDWLSKAKQDRLPWLQED